MAWKIRQKPILPWEQMPRHGLHQHVFENKFPFNFPQPGAQAYAFESLGLVEFSPIGPSGAVLEPLRLSLGVPQMFSGQAVVLQGIGIQSGQLISQPLIDPDAGSTGNFVAVERRTYQPNSLVFDTGPHTRISL